MAYPQVAAKNWSQDDFVANHTVNLPAGINAGDLLMVFFIVDDVEDCTFPGDWTRIKNFTHATNTITIAVAYKEASGSEGASITVGTTNEQSVSVSYRITGWDSAIAPEISTGAEGTNTSPNPDSLTPAGGSKEYLWVAVCAIDSIYGVTAYPTNYTDTEWHPSSGGESGGVSMAICNRELTAVSEDPGAFTISADQWLANTIAVAPLAATPQIQINIGDAWKDVEGMQINIGDAWKEVAGVQINIGDAWKEIF